jgi:hypothetical protein
MNRYGHLAKRHWQQTDPHRYARIADPETFFTDLGHRAQEEIEALSDHLAGPDRPQEPYLDKVGRLNMARLQAEERILTELIWIAPPSELQSPEASKRQSDHE